MERKQLSIEEVEAPPYVHNEDSADKLLQSTATRRGSRKSWDYGHPKDTEQPNFKAGSSLKDIRRLSRQSTVWDLQKNDSRDGAEIVAYKRRWIMLFLVVLFGLVGSFQWIMYSIIANVITKYYNVSNLSVDFTNLSFLIAYIVLFLPAGWLLDSVGMRGSVLLGCFANVLGGVLRVFSVPPNRFWLTMLGQVIVGQSQVFIAMVPTRLAVVWFPAHQVSIAISIGFNGFLVGNAIGFLVPPLIVRNSDNMDDIGADLNVLYISVAAASLILFILTLFLFQDEPPLPPSRAQKIQRDLDESKTGSLKEFVEVLKRLVRKKTYLILLFSLSANVGVFVAIATLLNQVLIPYFPGYEKEIGLVGLIFILSGVVSALMNGYILDRTHAYKLTIQVLYILSLVGWIAMTVMIRYGNMTWVFISSAVLGFAQGNQAAALELGVEITYPESEAISSGLLFAMLQIFGIFLTLLYGFMLGEWGDIIANAIMTIPLILGILSLMMMRPRLKRQAAQVEKDAQQLEMLKI